MSQHYIFNEAGSIPGIPGTFANCRVDVAEDGTYTVQPLAQHPAMVVTSEVPVVISVDEAVKAPAESAPTSDIVQEQVPPGLALNIG